MGIIIKPVPAGSRVSNGLSAGNSVVYQNEKPNDQQNNRTISIILTEFDNQGNRTDRNISSWEFRNRRAAISQDGSVVAWQTNSTTDGGKDDILLLDLIKPNALPRRITQSPENDGHPFFSRDGEWLLFESDRTGNWEIFKIHIFSGTVTQLTDDSSYVSTRPRW
jgi:Tol biopolymer transport system component